MAVIAAAGRVHSAALWDVQRTLSGSCFIDEQKGTECLLLAQGYSDCL